jgi:hypothetical protein
MRSSTRVLRPVNTGPITVLLVPVPSASAMICARTKTTLGVLTRPAPCSMLLSAADSVITTCLLRCCSPLRNTASRGQCNIVVSLSLSASPPLSVSPSLAVRVRSYAQAQVYAGRPLPACRWGKCRVWPWSPRTSCKRRRGPRPRYKTDNGARDVRRVHMSKRSGAAE